jgi:hypothetical protein
MSLAADEVRVGITGEMFSAPLATSAPTDSSTTLAAAWIGHGYVTDDGVTEAWDDSVDTIVAWQNATTVRATRTESTLTLACTLLQTRGSNLELFYPGSTVEANGDEYKIDVMAPTSDRRSFVLNVVDGDDVIRIYLPNAELTDRGEVPYKNGDAVMYPVTITAFPNSSNVLMTKFSNSAAWATDISGS